MMFLDEDQAASIRETVRTLAEERENLKRKVEQLHYECHRLRIENDKLRKGVHGASSHE
jgi:regulator of replication initiation timing